MMLAPLSLPNVTSLTGATNLAGLTKPQAATLEGLPIYLLPTGTVTPTFNFTPKLIQDGKFSWACGGNSQPKVDTSKHFHIFIGDLSPEVENSTLREAFAPFGEISDSKVIRDLQTLKSKGYGFVSFVNKEDAQRAIDSMNGQWLGRRTIRTNWAARKPSAPQPSKAKQPRLEEQTYEEIYGQTGPTNCTVYVGGTSANANEEQLKEFFSPFGSVMEVRVFKQQGYSFVRFDTKESAAQAICQMNGATLDGSVIRCSWGKEEGSKAAANAAALAALAQYSLAQAATNPFSYLNYGNFYTNPNSLAQCLTGSNWAQQLNQQSTAAASAALAAGYNFTFPANYI